MQSHLNMTTTKGGGFKDYNKIELINTSNELVMIDAFILE